MIFYLVYILETNRIHTFDIVRAIAITLMVLAHVHKSWLEYDSRWMEGTLYCILGPMGIPGFVMVSGMSFGFSWENNTEKGMNYKKNFNYQLSRTIVLLIVAFGNNLLRVIIFYNTLLSTNQYPWFIGPSGVILNIFYWLILFTLGFSRLFGAYTMRLNKIWRFIFSIGLILITPIILQGLKSIRSTSILGESLYWILFNGEIENPILMYFPCFMIGTILGQEIYSHTKTNSFENLKKLLIAGIIVFFSGILSGLRGLNSSQTIWAWTTEFATNPNWNITETPMFLVKNEFPWILYSSGWLIILTIFIYYKIDYKKKPKKAYFFELYGKYSLTIYLVHYICNYIPLMLSYKLIGFAFLIFMFILWILLYLIDTKAKGKISLEYVMGIGAKKLSSLMIKKSSKTKINSNE